VEHHGRAWWGTDSGEARKVAAAWAAQAATKQPAAWRQARTGGMESAARGGAGGGTDDDLRHMDGAGDDAGGGKAACAAGARCGVVVGVAGPTTVCCALT
jgi:hypothetical protein